MVSLLIGGGYFFAARGVQNFYPFSVVDMYANREPYPPSRIIAVDARGAAWEVTQFDRWRCAGPVSADPQPCPAAGEYSPIGYVDRDAVNHIAAHASDHAEGEPVRVVRRVWRLDGQPGPPLHIDCPLSACTAVRR